MQATILYDNDYDGCTAAAALIHFGHCSADSELIPYSRAAQQMPVPKHKLLYILDISLSPSELEQFPKDIEIIIIDHHLSTLRMHGILQVDGPESSPESLETYSKFNGFCDQLPNFQNIKLIFKLDWSTAMLVHSMGSAEKNRSHWLINAIDSYDIGNYFIKGYDVGANAVMQYIQNEEEMNSAKYSVAQALEYLKLTTSNDEYVKIYKFGLMINAIFEKRVWPNIYPKVTLKTLTLGTANIKCGVVRFSKINIAVQRSIYSRYPEAIDVLIFYFVSNNKYILTIRQRIRGLYNLDFIANQLGGGGGHLNAAGCTLTRSKFAELFGDTK